MNIMKNRILSFVTAACALFLASCLQHEMTITLNKDGSGTLVEETVMGGEMLAMLEEMAAGFGGGQDAGGGPLDDLLSEDKAKKRAGELGEGVTFAKIEPIDANGGKGARVTYNFEDINKLRPDLGSGMNNMPGADEDDQDTKENPLVFQYEGGKLTLTMPKPEKDEAADAVQDVEMPDDPQATAMMKQVFRDMKMSMKLVIAPGIAETNATHRDGDTITLMEMDFGKIVENPDGLKKLAATQNEEDPARIMESLKDIDGMKIETEPELTVTLK